MIMWVIMFLTCFPHQEKPAKQARIMENLFKSKRFWAVAAVIAVVVLKDKVPLTEQQITEVVMAVGAWVVGESIRPVEPKS